MTRARFADLLILLMFMSLASLAAATGPAVEASYGPSQVAIEPSGAYSRVSIGGTRTLGTPGAPALPVQYFQFVIPPDARVEDVLVTWLEEEEFPGTYRVVPAQPEVPIGETPRWVDPDPGIYESGDTYPATRAQYLGDGHLGGYHIAGVAVYPLTYRPLTGKLMLARGLSVELSLVPGASRSHPRQRMTARSDRLYRRIVESLVVNPDEVGGKLGLVEIVDELGPEGFLPRYTPSLEGSPVEYVIITSEEFEPYFQELADWKTKKGVPTVIRTVSWIEANYQGGCDTAERIRLFIRDAYSSWGTTYVLLGGDTDVVPVRYAWSDYYSGWDISTDLYFSDLDGNWNGDADSEFGEGYGGAADPGDSVDLYPDVFVGRAPATSATEVEVFIDKVLTYEKAPDAVFAGRDLFMAEVLFPYDWEPGDPGGTSGADIVEEVLPLIPPEVHYTRLYQNTVPFPGSYLLTRASAIDSITAGYNIAAHIGHGNTYTLRCGGGDEYLTIEDVDALANGQDKSGFAWMLNCSSTATELDCISEHFLNNPDGGCSSLFGLTRFGFPSTVRDYFYEWFEDLYVEGRRRAGVVCATCKIPYVPESQYDNTDRWTQMSYLYLGDPEVRLWTARPEPLTVVHAPSVVLGPTDLSVTVTDPAVVDTAFVCVAKDDEVYATGYTDASGEVVLSFTPRTAGAATITVTATDHLPYEGTITVAPTPAPHLSLRATVVDDDALGASDGNGNASAEAGETVELDVVIGNGGEASATNVTATLLNGDPYVSLLDDTHFMGDIPPLSEVSYEAAFVVAIEDSCPNEHEVSFELILSDGVRTTWPDELVLRIYRPDLIQALNEVNDGPGGDGVPDVGETVVLTISVLNDGNGLADQVIGVLRYPGVEITITDSTDSWGDIEPGAAAAGQTGFVFDVNAPITGRFGLVLTDEDGKVWPLSFDLTRPGVPDSLSGAVRGTSIAVSWHPVTDADLWGYNIYRADPGGVHHLANNGVVERISYFEDSGLEGTTLYDYRVTAVDSSGNESPPSASLAISTNPSSMPGWPQVPSLGESMYGSPAIADIDLDGDLEIFVGSGDIYCWHHTGVGYIDGDGDPRTNGVFADDHTGGTRTSIGIGEMDGDVYPELVAAGWGNVGTGGDPVYEVWAWNADDGTVVSGWPVTTGGRCWASATLADLDHDGLDEVVIPCTDSYVYCWGPGGTEFIDGDNDPSTIGVFAKLHAPLCYGSAAAADIDNDRDLEIVCGSRSDSVYCWNPDGSYVSGWPIDLGADIRTSIVVGDVDNDGSIDVVAGSLDNEVYLLTASGTVFPNWPKPVLLDPGGAAGDFPPSPVIANIDGGDDLEIVCPGGDGSITVWTWEGAELSGWPQYMDGGCRSTPSAGDVDGDPGVEIVVGCTSGKIYAFEADGSLADGWPIQTGPECYSTPSFADMDGDGDLEVAHAGMDATVYVWDTQGAHNDGDGIEWATFQHDYARSGRYGYEQPVGVPDDAAWSPDRLSVGQSYPNPFNPVTTIVYVIPIDVREAELSLHSVAGGLVRTLVRGEVEPGRHVVTWDGRNGAGERVASGVYFVRLCAGTRSATGKVVLLK